MKTLQQTKKITLATLKSFAKRNSDKLYYKPTSSFDGMTDCVETIKSDWRKTEITDNTQYFRTGIQGIYTVGHSDDYLTIYEDEDYFGITIYNCCGSSILAIKKEVEFIDFRKELLN